MVLVYENESVKFYLNNENKVFRAEFYGAVDMKRIIEAFDFVVSSPENMDTKAIITDLTKMEGTFTMLMNYFETKLYPYLQMKGVLCDAIITNKDVFTKFSVKKLGLSIDYVKIKAFTDEKSANEWIDSILKNA